MSKTFVPPELEMSPEIKAPASIADLASAYLKSESWVKARKTTLKEAYWWMFSDLVDDSGSLIEQGLEKFNELFEMTSNTCVVVQRGKRVSKRKNPRMTLDEYKTFVWTVHAKTPADVVSSFSEPLVSDQATSQGSDQAIEAEIILTEINPNPVDFVAEMEEDALTLRHEAKQIRQHSMQQLDGGLDKLRLAVKARVRQKLAGVVDEAIAEEVGDLFDGVEEAMPKPTQTKVKRSPKKP